MEKWKVDRAFYQLGQGEPERKFHTGYSPAFKYDGEFEFHSGRLLFDYKSVVLPGASVTGLLELLHPERIEKSFSTGAKLKFYEGDKSKGECTIILRIKGV